MAPGAQPRTGASRERRGGRGLTARRAGGLLVALAICLCPCGRAAAAPPHPFATGFGDGLAGFNLSGVGDVAPRVVPEGPGGNAVCRVELTGRQGRSELILGGDGGGGSAGTMRFHEGAEYWYSFSFEILRMVWGDPRGAWNLMMQFKSNGTGSPAFGLGLWDFPEREGGPARRGLWTEGAATGERFLGPLGARAWHRVEIHFRASERGRGFYRIYLDRRLVDAGDHVSMIVPGRSYGYIKTGLYRNGGAIPGKSALLLDAVSLSARRPG